MHPAGTFQRHHRPRHYAFGRWALLRGLDTLIQNETGIDVHIAEAPLDCVALGAGAVLDNPDLAGKRREEMSYL